MLSLALSSARQTIRGYYGSFAPVIKQLPGREGYFAVTTVCSSCAYYSHLPMPRLEAIILQRETADECTLALAERVNQLDTIRAAYETERRAFRRKAA